MNRFGICGSDVSGRAIVERGECVRAVAAEPESSRSGVRGCGKPSRRHFVRTATPRCGVRCSIAQGKLLAINATDTGGTPQNPSGSGTRGAGVSRSRSPRRTRLWPSAATIWRSIARRSDWSRARTDRGQPVRGTSPTDAGVAPLWGLGASNPYRSEFGFGLGGDDGLGGYHHGIITFAGGQPVYTKGRSGCGGGGGKLIGAVGVSGDGVDQDDAVALNTVVNPPISLCTKP